MIGQQRRMRIGIDGHVLGKNIGGVERYLTQVVERVPDLMPQADFVVFITRHAKARARADQRANVVYVELPVSDPLIQRSVILPWAVRHYALDLLQVQRIAPWACGSCKIILTVHDLTPLFYKAAYPGLRNTIVRWLTPSSLRRADLILCPTQTVCDQIATAFPDLSPPRCPFYLGADRGHFVPADAMAIQEARRRHGLTKPFVFSPGAVEARKNLECMLKSLAAIPASERPELVLSGPIRDRAYFDQTTELARSLGVADCLRHLGFVTEQDLVALYSGATLCIAASRDEGFNLLPIEAMACDKVVLCSDIPVHRELFSAGADFFGPDDHETLAALLCRYGSGSGSERLAQGRRDCLAHLSWDAMARRMAAFFDTLGGSDHEPRTGVEPERRDRDRISVRTISHDA